MVYAWSIGTGKRGQSKSSSAIVPGPGTYTLNKEAPIIPPKWKFGTSTRSNLEGNQVPGPGQYISNSTIKGEKYSIGTGKKPKVESFLFVPGPGAYTPSKSPYYQTPHYSMGLKTSQSDRRFAPGPGAYDHKSSVANLPTSKFGKSQRSDLYQSFNNPGPGNYEVVRPTSAAPKYGFGTSQRDGLYGTKETPGRTNMAGQYNQQDSIDGSKGKTMISRRDDGAAHEAAKVPGPGTYNPNLKDKRHNPTFKIGSELRGTLNSEHIKTPGPGAYDPLHVLSRPTSSKIGVGTDLRKPLNMTQDVPGPGQYNVRPEIVSGPKLSFKGVNKLDAVERERQKVPGPGEYMPSVNSVKQRPCSAKIGTSLRPSMYGVKDAPGPGNYNISGKQHGPQWGFGSGLRGANKNADDPGPGTYDIPAFFADVPKFMMNTSNQKIHYP